MTRESVLVLQGVYYAATGLWSLVSIGSFQRVTGPKVDTWLVKTVGALVLVSGSVIASAGLRRRATPEVLALGTGSAVVFIVIDATYAAKRRISPVYLLDAVAQAALLATLALLPGEQKREG